MGKVATPPVPSWGSPRFSAGTKSELATSSLPSRGPTCRQNGYTHTASGAHMWAKWLQPLPSRGSATLSAGIQSEVATQPLPSRGPTCRQSGYITLHGQNHKWLIHPCRLEGPHVGKVATQPLSSRGPPTRGQSHEWLLQPCRLGSPHVGKMATLPPVSWPPMLTTGDKIRNGYITPAFGGEPTCGQNAYITLDVPGVPNKGTKSKVAT